MTSGSRDLVFYPLHHSPIAADSLKRLCYIRLMAQAKLYSATQITKNNGDLWCHSLYIFDAFQSSSARVKPKEKQSKYQSYLDYSLMTVLRISLQFFRQRDKTVSDKTYTVIYCDNIRETLKYILLCINRNNISTSLSWKVTILQQSLMRFWRLSVKRKQVMLQCQSLL